LPLNDYLLNCVHIVVYGYGKRSVQCKVSLI
jgi:hypothetical protein